ncbi:MAG: glycine--tRNA ligase [Oscillospiraceae bacterium]|nr:glycine--tRNA ligase [Oscillospiraceae bacterium]
MENSAKSMEKIVALCKNRGFIFAGSEIYGGLANTWDYGPLGVELKNNVKRAWWKKFVQENPYNVGLDAAILMNPQTWVASGHVGGFSDPLMDCKECKERFRADKVIEDWCGETGFDPGCSVDAMSQNEMKEFIETHEICCPSCGKRNWTDIRQFNLMFKTFQGVTEDAKNTVYLRPETAQGIFVNFNNVQRTTRRKLPFGVCQIGKSFRNEITPGNFTFRTREFEQMELEFFCKPGTELEWFAYWKQFCHDWLLSLGMQDDNLRLRDHEQAELSHYSNATTDVEFAFPFGWGELWGVASRTNFDLTAHQNTSGQDMSYYDQEQNEHYIPYVVEPSLGADRVTLAFLLDAYDEEVVGQDKKGNDDVRTVLHLHPALAPYKCAVLPLSKKPVLTGPATELYQTLSRDFMCDYDETGSIGKRYRRADEIGTPFCITLDFDTVGDPEKGTPADGCVTIRERDSMQQVRLPIAEVRDYIAARIRF